MNWDAFLKILSAVVALYQLIKPGGRSTLKTDLEILNLLKASNPVEGTDENYKAVKSHVDKSIRKIYPTGEGYRFYRDGDFIKGISIFAAFSSITVYWLMGGFTYWSLASGFAALTGLAGALRRLRGGGGRSDDER